MADPEIEAEWAKSKRIEKEKMKAASDSEAVKADANSLAHLDPIYNCRRLDSEICLKII